MQIFSKFILFWSLLMIGFTSANAQDKEIATIDWDEGIYHGEIKDNEPHGFGKLTIKEGHWLEGEWKKGYLTGHGTEYLSYDDINDEKGWYKYVGNFFYSEENGKGKETDSDGNWYEGEWKDGNKHGFGSENIQYGETVWEKYIGDFVEDFRHGKGKLTHSDGNWYDGEWKLDERHGFGTDYVVYEDNSWEKYTGFFSEDWRHGKGKLMTSEGVVLEGEFEADAYLGDQPENEPANDNVDEELIEAIDDPIAYALKSEALLHQGEFKKAAELGEQVLSNLNNLFGDDHLSVAIAYGSLANAYVELSQLLKAEELYLQAIPIIENELGADHPQMGAFLSNLGTLYLALDEYAKAERYIFRALTINEDVYRSTDYRVASSFQQLSDLYTEQGRYKEAESYARKTIEIFKQELGILHPRTSAAINSLATVFIKTNQFDKAEELYEQSLELRTNALNAQHPLIASSLNNLAFAHYKQKQYNSSEPLFKRSLSIRETVLGPYHLDTGQSLNNLGLLHQDQNDFAQANFFFSKSVSVFKQRAVRANNENAAAQIGLVDELSQFSGYFQNHIFSSANLAVQEPSRSSSLMIEAFDSAQFASHTSAGNALGQAAARFAADDDALSGIVRNRQDLVGEWGAVSGRLTSSISGAPDERSKKQEQNWRDRMASIDAELAEIDTRLESEFPEYFALVSPKPLSLAETEGLLYDNESLVMFLSGDEGTIVFAITSDKTDWVLVKDVNLEALNEAVRVLRISLENPQNAFPRDQAHGIYRKLMGGVEDIVSGKEHVFIVPSGALGSIPLGVLVTEEPTGNDASPDALRNTKWWGTEQALTTLPSISSLRALRLLAKDGRGTEPFAGFGNPVLLGPRTDDANDADKTEGDTNRAYKIASRGTAAYFRGKYGDVDAIRTLTPLPKTETELISLAGAMGAKPKNSLWLADRATEANLKTADLSKKRVLAFATHGLMSGEMSGLAEPALVLTPPNEATDEDDGLLTASEAALLNLNADWVILSACNTAAAEKPGADGLSGLARSFFYAGARAMLVSHWPVRDDAAARLTTEAIAMQDKDPYLGRAEALRRSMLVLMNDTTDPSLAHPSAWAPFVIVGEGGSQTTSNHKNFDPTTYVPTSTNISSGSNWLWVLLGGGLIILLMVGVLAGRRKQDLS